MLHDRNGCLVYCVPSLDIFVIVSCMIDTRYCLRQAKLDVTYRC